MKNLRYTRWKLSRASFSFGIQTVTELEVTNIVDFDTFPRTN